MVNRAALRLMHGKRIGVTEEECSKSVLGRSSSDDHLRRGRQTCYFLGTVRIRLRPARFIAVLDMNEPDNARESTSAWYNQV